MTDARLPQLGALVLKIARDITREVGGTLPESLLN
jgi:hypothetical protein